MCHAHAEIRHYRCCFSLVYLWFIKVLMIIIRTLVRWTAVRVCLCTHCCLLRWVIILYIGSTHIGPCTCCLCSHSDKLIHRFAPNFVLFLSRRIPIELYHMLFYRVTGVKESNRYIHIYFLRKAFDSFNLNMAIWQRGGKMLIAYDLILSQLLKHISTYNVHILAKPTI